ATREFNISIPEFTVAGIPCGNFFGHQWYIACDDMVDELLLGTFIDEQLKELNDDYAVERKSALREVKLKIMTEQQFMDFMHKQGKIGGQHKFPRVLKGKMLKDWQMYLQQYCSADTVIN
ncbi:MAG: GH3 auxin-responsive promoter, partial [Sphingobacteriia bacterium]